MHVHVLIVEEGLLLAASVQVPHPELPLADGDAARERAGIAVDPVVGDLQVVVPGVHEDATTTLRAVGQREAVDARRVAQEVRPKLLQSELLLVRTREPGGKSPSEPFGPVLVPLMLRVSPLARTVIAAPS